jgi:hypothetical protein
MTETLEIRRNGVGAPMPIKSVLIDCDEAGYPGWHVRLRTNVSSKVFDDFVSQDQERFWRSLSAVILEWNFADADGEPLPTPAEGLDWTDLPFDLATHLVRSYLDAFAATAQLPKASAASSAATSRTDADHQGTD